MSTKAGAHPERGRRPSGRRQRPQPPAEIPVPGWLAGWDRLDAALPAPVQRLGRRLVGDRRGLTSVDDSARRAYKDTIAEQQAE